MGTTTQIYKPTLSIVGHCFTFRYGFNQLNFKRLVFRAVKRNRFISGPHPAFYRLISVNNFMHPGLNGRQLICRERLFAMKIIVKPIFNRRTYGDLHIRIQFQHGFSHDMRTVMTNQFQRSICIFSCYQRQFTVFVDWSA